MSVNLGRSRSVFLMSLTKTHGPSHEGIAACGARDCVGLLWAQRGYRDY